MPARVLSPLAAAGSALINSVGNRGGFAGPYLPGSLHTTSAGFAVVLAIFGGFLALSALINFAVARLDNMR